MIESVKVAISYLKSNCTQLKLPVDFSQKNDFNIHFPDGAIPKDGPSAGITIFTALVSAVTGKIVRDNLAMTGELTITGKVLPIGGLKEKTLAALRNNIKEIVIPYGNKKDVAELPESVKKNIKIHYVKNASEVIKYALSKEIDKNNTFSKNK